MDSLTLKRQNSFLNENSRKATRNFARRRLVFKLQPEVLEFNHVSVSWSSPETDLEKNFLDLGNWRFENVISFSIVTFNWIFGITLIINLLIPLSELKSIHYKHQIRGCSYEKELARLGWLAHLDELIFISRSYGVFYLTSSKNFDVLLEKDCFDHAAFKADVFLFSMRYQKGCRNFIFVYKMIYFTTSWNFTCKIIDLEKYV